jgi:thioesterase III
MSTPAPPLPGWFIHTSEWVIGELDIDLLGHLNNVAAMALFERARWNMITERGHGADVIRRRAQAPVIVEVDVQFRREVTLRQRVTIDTYTAAAASRVGTIVQIMRAENGAPHIVATYTVSLFDLNTRRLITATPEWRFACGDPHAAQT